MPLLDMSPNIQDPESPSRKRSHEDFMEHSSLKPGDLPDMHHAKPPLRTGIENAPLAPSIVIDAESPFRSSPSPLTDAGSRTPSLHSPSPDVTPVKAASLSIQSTMQTIHSSPAQSLSTTTTTPGGPTDDTTVASGQPAAKRKRLTAAEKEEKAKADAARKAAKEAEKAAAEAEKKARAEEREKKRKQKEEEDRRRTEEKEKKRREKEEEERRIQEAKEKKERSQLKLNSFFKTGLSTPKKKPGSGSAEQVPGSSPLKAPQAGGAPSELSVYDKVFKPFFVKENVTLATTAFDLDPETKVAKSRILDEHLRGERGPFKPGPLSAASTVEYFHLPSAPRRRGRRHPSVRKIMNIMSDIEGATSAQATFASASASAPASIESQHAKIKATRDLLKSVPVKFLGFREDVRPAYIGTVTNMPPDANLARLARKPTSKEVLPLNYDYDSEAEWVDDGDGESVDIADDEDEDLEEEDEMGDFLDDSEDSGPARAAFSAGMEPESTGLCWENRQRLGPLPHMYKYRMEFILGNLEHHNGINPWSTEYWETEQDKTTKGNDQTLAVPATGSTSTSTASAAKTMAPPPAPADAFSALSSSSAAGGKADAKKAVVPAELMGDFKRAVLRYPKLSKLGIIEILNTEFIKCTKNQVRNTLEMVAERTGAGHDKTWKLKEGFGL